MWSLRRKKPLPQPKYTPFPLPSITATGWLLDQLTLQAHGLPGHLFDFYRYVAHSAWLGGNDEYSDLHESAPYWFNYIVPLAYTLDDARLKTQAKRFLDYVLAHQAEDGWLGPEEPRRTKGIWARSILFFGLMQYAEADPRETDRIVTAMHRFTVLAHAILAGKDEDEDDGFALVRTHEFPLVLQWLYETHPRSNARVIWETMERMFARGRRAGADWTAFFVDGVFPTRGTPRIETSSFTHGVNLAEGLRYPTVLYRVTRDESLRAQTMDAVKWTFEYHSSRAGSIVADEHLGGLSPLRGSETCMAVEVMFSMSYLYRFYGLSRLADRAERAAFNALPGAISPDWWAHQYVQQTNQPWSRNLTGSPYFNVVPYGNTFGLEPHYPCCTVNHGQGYPKYVASSYVREGEQHVIHALLGPTTLKTKIKGKEVTISCQTNYPFSGKLKYSIVSATDFEFSVRIPTWTAIERSYFSIDEKKPLSPDSGLQLFRIHTGKAEIAIHLDMAVRIADARNGSVAIYYGPLLYALDIETKTSYHSPLNWADRTPLPGDQITPETRDYVLEPASEWRYAIDPASVTVEEVYNPDSKLPDPIWTRDATPVALWVDGWKIDWPDDQGTAGLPPVDPVVTGKPTKIRLIPYGAAKLHIVDFPVVKLE